jgi:hypothetical protein
MPDHVFSRCDGHHEMVDFRLRKGPRSSGSRLEARPRRHRVKAKESPYRSGRSPDWLKNEELGGNGRETGRGGRMGQKEMAMTGKKPHHVYGPKNDGTNIIEFHTAAGEALAISVPAGETRVLKYFQQRMP